MLLMSRQEGAADPPAPGIIGGFTEQIRHLNRRPYLRLAPWFAYSQIRFTVDSEFFMQSPTEIPPR
jgi:hypothetical protein